MLRGILHVLSFRGREWVYCSLAIAVAAIAASALLLDKAKPKENPAGLKQIGTLSATGDDVKRKFFSQLDFEQTAAKDNVFLKDTLFVGPNSKVSLALGEYGDFELSPNSILLVYLDFETKNGAKNPAATNSSVGQSLKLKLTQGELKYKKPKKSVQAANEPVKTVAVEIADNTFLKLDGQEELKVERTKGGEITVHEATITPQVEKIPDPVAIPISTKADEVAPAAIAPPESEHFALKVGESFIESEIKLHASLIQEERSPAKIEESVQTKSEPASSQESVESEAKPLSVVVQKPTPKKRLAAVTEEEKPKEAVVAEPAKVEVAPEPVASEPVATAPSEIIQKNGMQGLYMGPLSYEVVSLGATDSSNLNITTTSKYVLGAAVGYGFDVSDSSILSVEAKIKRYQFVNVSTVTLSENNPTTFAFKVNYEKQTSKNLALSASAGVEEILNLEPKSSSQVNLKNLLSPQVGIGASYRFGDATKWFKAYEIKASVDALLPAKGDTYTSKLGHKEQLKFLTVKDSDASRFSGGFTAYQQKFSTPFSETTQFGIGIEFSIGLGAADKKRSDLEVKESEGAK